MVFDGLCAGASADVYTQAAFGDWRDSIVVFLIRIRTGWLTISDGFVGANNAYMKELALVLPSKACESALNKLTYIHPRRKLLLNSRRGAQKTRAPWSVFS